MSPSRAVAWTFIWIGLSVAIGIAISLGMGREQGVNFFTVYAIEKTLSFDNLFVFFLIFSYFKTPDELKLKILTYGIVGAIVFRAIFIFSGSFLFDKFEWLLYLLGAGLVYLGFNLFFEDEQDDEDVADMWAVKFSKKHLGFENSYEFGSLISIRSFIGNNKIRFTLTFLVIVVVEISDIIFAIDSVPAAFAITNDGTIIYVANLCAILGLRSLYFVMDAFINRLKFINYGVGIILAFIGFKILSQDFLYIDPVASMVGVLGVLVLTFIVSMLFTRGESLSH